MAILILLLNVAGATMLLLFGVKTIQAGIEKRFSGALKRALGGRGTRLRATGTGLLMAMALQSSAAVAMLSVSLVETRVLKFAAALAAVLGADLGSALVVQILSFRHDWMIPFLLTIGGWLFIKTRGRAWREFGRMLLGIALILIAIQFLSAAFVPIKEAAILPAISGYLQRDFISAFLIGAVLALMMHSSVAVILMCVAVVTIEAIPPEVAINIVLGANLGSAVLALWLTRGFSADSRLILYASLVLRGSCAVAALFLFQMLSGDVLTLKPGFGQGVIWCHLGFNAMLLIFVPLTGWLEGPAHRLSVALSPPSPAPVVPHQEDSSLDPNVIDIPVLALASIRRELVRMSQIVLTMTKPLPYLYRTADAGLMAQIRSQEPQVNQAMTRIRRYISDMPFDRMSPTEKADAMSLAECAIELEAAGDVVHREILRYAQRIAENKVVFSEEGWSELIQLHQKVMDNMNLAFGVLVTDDVDIARRVVEEKASVRELERQSRRRHFERLRAGHQESIDSSNIHLETLRALKELNARITTVAYPTLQRAGHLLETRLGDGEPTRDLAREVTM